MYIYVYMYIYINNYLWVYIYILWNKDFFTYCHIIMNQSRTTPEVPTIVWSGQLSTVWAEFTDLIDWHSDARRDLWALFNKQTMQQVKVANIKNDAVLWGHMHPYVEMFTVWTWKALFRLFDPKSNTIEHYLIIPGKRLVIPAHVPHDAFIPMGTFLVWATERAYIDPATNDIPVTLPPFSDIEKALAQ